VMAESSSSRMRFFSAIALPRPARRYSAARAYSAALANVVPSSGTSG
jgi:hypothetical protein